jgi:hypothetical protein
MTASRAFVLFGRCLPYHNTDFENLSQLCRACEFRRTNNLIIFSTYHFIFTTLDKTIAEAILAMPVDDMMKVLVAGMCKSTRAWMK